MPLRLKTEVAMLLLCLGRMLGCGGSKEDQARQLDQKRASWEATARLTDELSQRGSVPVYRRQVRQKFAEALQQIRKQQHQLGQ
jgi:hypothetical protein